MYFKKLEISGFKSFAQKTLLHFEPGITAIVGPNGCGKSNIFDSIRWCLGEQSIKSLRGSKMEDVIFNGTETVPAQNMAEVSLTISNEAKILPIDYEEVAITRRLFRSGESEYLINNNTVRLKDINDLLMGTGIGAESYSLVEQGKIDLVISSKPEDRRLVFDEATGVSKYKAKKKEAMRKLEETDNNLLRVNDIIVEVKRQIGSIERQANKARRYKEIFDKLKNLELKFSTLEIQTVGSELLLLTEMVRKSSAEENQLNDKLQALDGKLITQQKQLQELDAKLTALKEGIAELEGANMRHRQHIILNRERVTDLNKHTDLLKTQKEQLKTKIAEHEKNISALNGQLSALGDLYREKADDVSEREETLRDVLKCIETQQGENAAAKQKIFDISVSETKTNNLMQENAAGIHTLSARQRRLEAEKIKTEEENAELQTNLGALHREIDGEKEKIAQIVREADRLKEKKLEAEGGLKNLESRLRGLENEKLSLQSQLEFLKELKLKYDGMPEAKNGVIEISDVPREKITGIIAHARDVVFDDRAQTYRISCECKFISFDCESLEMKIREAAAGIEGLTLSMSEKEKQLMDLLEQLTHTEEGLQQEKFHLTNKEAVAANLSDNAKKILEELKIIQGELGEVVENLKKSKQDDEKYKKELETFAMEKNGLEETISRNIHKINEEGASKEKILVEIAQLKTELANQKAKEDGLRENLNFFQKALAEDSGALDTNDREIADSLQKARELQEENVRLEAEVRTNEEEVKSKNQEHTASSQVRVEEVNGIDFLQKQIIDLEEKADRIKEDNHRFQMQEQELNFKHTNIKNRILSAYNVDLDETPFPPEAGEEFPIEQGRQEIETLKEKVASFGNVNLVAIEELEELKNRHDFLTQQQNDLNLAKESLKNAIQKINRTTRKMFLETFQMVAEEFKNYFKLLFGGGEAKLFLIDEEDVLESGIEIICRPPGKKLQNISLLSGGEKALSAIALIFAIFKTKPSPFCVLDEIDAALDESNIDRFSRMLADFSKTSQFITITHNKKTISRANVMYGITMERSGISKIVSVKLHENSHAPKTPVAQDEEKLTPEAA